MLVNVVVRMSYGVREKCGRPAIARQAKKSIPKLDVTKLTRMNAS